tara:strand:- start:12492 stop:12866 length:375 start_codon:yes stop_codon:yes gene_type:complete
MERSSTWAQGEEEQGLDSDITLEQFVGAFSDPYINPELFEYDPIIKTVSHPDLTFIGATKPINMDVIIYNYTWGGNYHCQFTVSGYEGRNNPHTSNMISLMTTKADMMARFFNSAGSVNRGKVS